MPGSLWEWLTVRALPPHLNDRAEEEIAIEAAQNGMRQALRFSSVAGLIVVSVLLTTMAMMYRSQSLRTRELTEAVSAVQTYGQELTAIRVANADLQHRLNESGREIQPGPATAAPAPFSPVSSRSRVTAGQMKTNIISAQPRASGAKSRRGVSKSRHSATCPCRPGRIAQTSRLIPVTLATQSHSRPSELRQSGHSPSRSHLQSVAPDPPYSR